MKRSFGVYVQESELLEQRARRMFWPQTWGIPHDAYSGHGAGLGEAHISTGAMEQRWKVSDYSPHLKDLVGGGAGIS